MNRDLFVQRSDSFPVYSKLESETTKWPVPSNPDKDTHPLFVPEKRYVSDGYSSAFV